MYFYLYSLDQVRVFIANTPNAKLVAWPWRTINSGTADWVVFVPQRTTNV